jgi:hypothetical protein
MKKIYIVILLLSTIGFSSNAQELNFDDLLKGGTADANQLLGGYLEPAFAGFGYALNAGWYNTGRPHKLLGFDLTFGLNAAMIPSSAQYYTFKPSATLGIDQPLNPSSPLYGTNKLPTLFGPNLNADDIPVLVFNQGQETEVKISGPTGLGIDEVLPFVAVPAPFAQLGIGLIKGTELKIRYAPPVDVDGNTLKTLGIGVMHDVKQWIPGVKNLPFDLSGFVAFNSLETEAVVNADLNQTAVFNVKGTTMQAIISKKLAILTVYGGLGFTTSKTEFKLLGDYANSLPDGTANTMDPINISSNNGGMRANVGARLKLLILTFHAEYALQQYNTLTAGIGISIR